MSGVPKQMNQIQLQEIAKWIHDAPLKSATSSAFVTWLLLGCATTVCAETWSCIPSSCFIAEAQPPNTYLELSGLVDNQNWQGTSVLRCACMDVYLRLYVHVSGFGYFDTRWTFISLGLPTPFGRSWKPACRRVRTAISPPCLSPAKHTGFKLQIVSTLPLLQALIARKAFEGQRSLETQTYNDKT